MRIDITNFCPTWLKTAFLIYSNLVSEPFLKIPDDVLLAADLGNCFILFLLDATAAFDTVDLYSILIHKLNQWAGVSDSALNCFH